MEAGGGICSIGIIARDAHDKRALGRLARDDRILDGDCPQVQAQIGLPLARIGSVAGEARLGEDRADVAAKAERRLRQRRFPLNPPELDHVVFFEKLLLLALEFESGRFDLAGDDLLPCPHVFEDPLRCLAFLAAIIDHHEPATRFQGGMERGQRFLGKLEVVVNVAEEDHIDRGRRQLAGIDFGEHGLDILDSGVFAGGLDMFEEVRGDVGRIDGPARRHLGGEQPREQPGAGPDVGHRHARLQPASGDDLLAEVEDLAALDLERGDELLRIGVLFVRRVDARIDALLLGSEGGGEEQRKEQKSEPEQ